MVLYRGREKKNLSVSIVKTMALTDCKDLCRRTGDLQAVAAADNYIEIYDTTTGNLGRRLRDCKVHRVRVAFSPDGNQLAVGQRTGLVTIYSLTPALIAAGPITGRNEVAYCANRGRATRPSATRRGHEARSKLLERSPVIGQNLISIGHDHTARCWDLGEQEESRVLRKGATQIDAMSYSPDGRYLVEASMNDGIRVHDLASKDPPHSLTTHPSRRAVFSPDGRTIAGGPDHRLTLWDAKTKELLCILTEPKLADKIADPNYHSLISEMGARSAPH